MKYNCKDIVELLPIYVDNMTNQLESAKVKEHLAECAECRREYEFLKNIIETTTELPYIEASQNFTDTLHSKLIAAKNLKSKKSLAAFRKVAIASLSSAAVIAISIVSLSVLDKKNIESIPQPKAQTSAYKDAEASKKINPELSVASEETQKPQETNDSEKETRNPEEDSIEKATQAPAVENDNTLKSKTSSNINTNSKEILSPKTEQSENIPSVANNLDESQSAIAADSQESQRDRKRISSSSSQTGSTVYNLDTNQSTALSGGGSSSAYSGPEKTKVTAIITTNSQNKDAVNNILSGYTYSNGVYVLTQAEYSSVLGILDNQGIHAKLSTEDKTADYVSLTAQLEGASKSEAKSIQNQLNEIDNEVSKKYIKVN